jgi:hypothetical protein
MFSGLRAFAQRHFDNRDATPPFASTFQRFEVGGQVTLRKYCVDVRVAARRWQRRKGEAARACGAQFKCSGKNTGCVIRSTDICEK